MCLVNELKSSVTRAATAARVIGVAAANNPTFQTHLYTADPNIVAKLIEVPAFLMSGVNPDRNV